jgi:hypothetical protein
MKAYPNLPAADVDALVAYMQTLKKKSANELRCSRVVIAGCHGLARRPCLQCLCASARS